jgi:hypothetical protein
MVGERQKEIGGNFNFARNLYVSKGVTIFVNKREEIEGGGKPRGSGKQPAVQIRKVECRIEMFVQDRVDLKALMDL